MREYYYLTGLEDSPYDLTIGEALHLGATYALSIYTFIDSDLNLSNYQEFDSITIREQDFFVRLTPERLTAFEKRVELFHGLCEEPTVTLQTAYVNEKFKGSVPIGNPLEHKLDSETEVCMKPAYSIHLSELLCWTDDLEKLAETGCIKRRDHDTGTAASDQPEASPPADQARILPDDFHALYDALGAGELPDLDLLILAWRTFWKGRRPNDGKKYPINADVADWIKNRMDNPEQGNSKAKAIASIIRPTWAPTGRQPNRNK